MKRTIITEGEAQCRAALANAWPWLKELWVSQKKVAITFGDVTRTLNQNAAQWPYLAALSEQSEWPVNGRMVKMSEEEWKDVLTAAFEKETTPRLAASWDGAGVVMLGQRTSEFGKEKFSEWIEFLKYACLHRGVRVLAYEREPR